MAQWYAQVGGQRYGPVSDEEIRTWFSQGRVKPADYVWSEGMSAWSQAGAVFGASQPAQGAADAAWRQTTSPCHPAAYGPAPVTQYGRPHRDSTVLVLGILSLILCCCICGIVAWVMGSNDLREMAAGRMDRSGESNTRAGRVCGIIGTFLGIIGILFAILELFVIVAATSHHGGGPFGGL